MIQTKTEPGFYDEHDYWTVSFTKIDLYSSDREEVVHTYRDIDAAYEDYCYYSNKWYALNCKFEHHRD